MSAGRRSAIDAAFIAEVVGDFLSSEQNDLQMARREPIWGSPLVGFAAGDDELWVELKRHIGGFHWTAAEAFSTAFPAAPARPADLTVIAWVLPQTVRTRRENGRQTDVPAERWIRAKEIGERCNDALRSRLVAALGARGVDAVAPVQLPAWRRDGLESDRYGAASSWSERHAAYAAGLGTFGLCDGLITPVGKAVRVGSVVARLALPVTPRPYVDHHAYCLFFHREQGCAACRKRCPVGAISERGHDKHACSAYLERLAAELIEPRYGWSTRACGLCQTRVPCAAGIPPSLRPAEVAGGKQLGRASADGRVVK